MNTVLISFRSQFMQQSKLFFFSAYFVRDNWRLLQALYTLPALLFYTYAWAPPESIRWLLSKKKLTEAERYYTLLNFWSIIIYHSKGIHAASWSYDYVHCKHFEWQNYSCCLCWQKIRISFSIFKSDKIIGKMEWQRGPGVNADKSFKQASKWRWTREV